MFPLGHPVTQSSHVDVLVSEKLLKIVATTGEIFNLKFTKYCLDGAKALSYTPSCNKKGLLLSGGEGERREGEEGKRKLGRVGCIMAVGGWKPLPPKRKGADGEGRRKAEASCVPLRHLRHVPPDSIAAVVNSLQKQVSLTLSLCA